MGHAIHCYTLIFMLVALYIQRVEISIGLRYGNPDVGAGGVILLVRGGNLLYFNQ